MTDLGRIPARRLARELIARVSRFKWRNIFRDRQNGDKTSRDNYRAFGEEILVLFRRFSESRGWRGSEDDMAAIVSRIRSGENQEVEFFCRLLNMLMPDYENQLYQYYALLQYHATYRCLQYPFLGPLLDMYVRPYQEAVKRVGPLRVLEYGPGIPYGLLYMLRECPSAVSHVTLVDLDLIYLEFAEFLVKHYGGHDLELNVLRLKTADAIPSLNPQFNMVFAKDVFEHLKQPEKIVHAILAGISSPAICFFDFRDHGEKLFLHVTPNVAYLKQIVEQKGLCYEGEVQQLAMFSKGTLMGGDKC
jgi:hypothetical protein